MKQMVFFLVIMSGLFSCTAPVTTDVSEESAVVENENVAIPGDTSLYFLRGKDSVRVDLHFPDSNWRGTLILLQGWNFPCTDWCAKTDVCARAMEEGFAVVCPDMGKSIYALKTYPETRADWKKYPTRTWVNDTLMHFLIEKQIVDKRKFTCALGLSTGARGAFFLALDHPELMDAVACLSGDYDQRRNPTDNLCRGFFGDMQHFPDRWSGAENPMDQLKRLKAFVYISHGKEDEVVAETHSAYLYSRLSEEKAVYDAVSGAGHDYTFWSSQIEGVLDFFCSKMDVK